MLEIELNLLEQSQKADNLAMDVRHLQFKAVQILGHNHIDRHDYGEHALEILSELCLAIERALTPD